MMEVTKGQLEVQIEAITQAKEVIQGEMLSGIARVTSCGVVRAGKAMGGSWRFFSSQGQGL